MEPIDSGGASEGGSLRIDWFDGSVSELAPPAPPVPPAPPPPPPAERKLMGFRRLAELAESTPGAVQLALSGRTSFWDLLDSDLKPDFIILIAEVLSRAAEGAPVLARPLLARALASRYVHTLERYLHALPLTRISEKRHNMQLWRDAEAGLSSAARLCDAAVRLLSAPRALRVAPALLAAARAALAGLRERHAETFSPALPALLHRVHTQLTHLTDHPETTEDEETHNAEGSTRGFRSVSVLPTREELCGEAAAVEAGAAAAAGGEWTDTEHYLEELFHRLREDYLAPLRDAMRKYLGDPSSKHDHIRVHAGARLAGRRRSASAGEVGRLLELPAGAGAALPHGSLLLLSADNFRTVLCATILETIASTLVCVSVHGAEAEEGRYVALESVVFVEPYRRVLLALQDTDAGRLPFAEHLVHLKTEIAPPAYLTCETEYIVRDGCGEERGVRVLSGADEGWAGLDAEALGMDDAQYVAYRHALTHRLALIQGPPGTGKTYMGVRIVRTLLENMTLAGTPLLLVSYTNRALDHFLHQLLHVTTDVVRLGSRSESELLAPYTLSHLRAHGRSARARGYRDKLREQDDLLSHAARLRRDMQACRTQLLAYRVVGPFLEADGRRLELRSDTAEDPVRVWLFSHLCDAPSEPDNDLPPALPEDTSPEEEHSLESCFSEARARREMARLAEAAAAARAAGTDAEPGAADRLLARSRLVQRQLECFQAHLVQGQWECFQTRAGARGGGGGGGGGDDVEQRWAAYAAAAERVSERCRADAAALELELATCARQLQELALLLDSELACAARVLAATTTAAARHRSLLLAARSPVLLVEEAAEVLEAHVVAALTPHCQHIILIGDHQQLRPHTATRQSALSVSLPERLAAAGVRMARLRTQRRMRPELLALISPLLYADLATHAAALAPPHVRGLAADLLFLTHRRPEERGGEGAGVWVRNAWEARWSCALAAHLRRQDYAAHQLVLLTPYAAQAQLITQESARCSLLAGVRVATVDNFQGEECEVVVLSLVRSNRSGDVGFLADPRRVAVALSRAERGLYMVGDESTLCARSELWRRVVRVLRERGALAESVALRCANHPDTVTHVTEPEQVVARSAHGGCGRACGAALPCGHACRALCHAYDPLHLEFICAAPCDRRCARGHACPLACGEACGACSERVEAALPCGHAARLPCFAVGASSDARCAICN